MKSKKSSQSKKHFKPQILLAEPFHLYILAVVISSENPKETTKENVQVFFSRASEVLKSVSI